MLAVHSWHYAQSKLTITWCVHLHFLRYIAILFRKKVQESHSQNGGKSLLISEEQKKSSQSRKSQKRKYSLGANVYDKLENT